MSIFSHKLRLSDNPPSASWRSGPRGFTLIELLAVTVIITIITLTMLLRQSSFDSTTVLRSVTYGVALSVRQAQVYGVSVLGANNAGAVTYAQAYGLYFGRTMPNTYLLYADFNRNGGYDNGETVKVFTLSPGYTIAEACVVQTSGVKNCTGSDDSAGTYTVDSVDIQFRRPNPDAVFNNNAGYVSAWVKVQAKSGTFRSVLITGPGQITVQAPGTLP
ncbi:prepilin-type N-terminal cleavage/methylation domain-containing protein [Patescibacteria group bacterium]|nr:prepilin-type N-terminal cleavage/methylation domain-containing protein [Patescibacteria group bacterium]